MRTRTLLALLALALAAPPAPADTREASLALTNRQGAPETWTLRETVSGGPADRVVRREYLRDGAAFYAEESRLAGGTLADLVVTDTRPGGEPVRVTVAGGRVTYVPLAAGGDPRVERVQGEVLAAGQVAPRLADLLRADPGLREHRFRVPVPKALKTAPMRATLSDVKADSFAVELRSTDVLVQAFFMRGSFRMVVDRASGRLLRYEGQPEPYDLSSGSARSVWVSYALRPAATPAGGS